MIFASFLVILGSIVVVASIEAAARGRLGVNSLIGIRIPSVMSSDEAWRRGHGAARIPVWIGACAAMVAGLVSLAIDEGARGAAVSVGSTLLLIGVTTGGFFASRAAATVMPPVFDDHP